MEELLPFATTRMNLEDIMLSEMIQLRINASFPPPLLAIFPLSCSSFVFLYYPVQITIISHPNVSYLLPVFLVPQWMILKCVDSVYLMFTFCFSCNNCHIKSAHLLTNIRMNGHPCWLNCKESACQCGRHRFNPWIGKIPCRREWQPTPVFLPGKFYEQRILAAYSPWGLKESDTTEHACMHNRENYLTFRPQIPLL